ncbi:MAG TPA: tyrosine--tRNA ligase [Candidatus Saccharimonadales bacterium]|nr:tyrosine--tRNA ligase [Candidatus Saccharimonadales bacterium]
MQSKTIRKMTLSEELQWRGMINQTTLGDITKLDQKNWTFYHGFDCSADSQAIGNLAAMMMDKVFMRHGCTAYILAGGATSLIGDPGGKDSERPLQDEATIAHNAAQAEIQLKRILQGYNFTLVNNLDWTKNLTVIAFLRDIGKYFSMTPLVQRDYVAKRLGAEGSGISYTEFSYTLLQGMDYLHLFDTYGVTLQLGGADQWGNCLSGVELIRRSRDKEVHVITQPLVMNRATGKKFGKSEEGAVWLDAKKTSPTQFYQFWINVDDEGVEDYLKVYTELDKESVDKVMARHRTHPEKRHAQTVLAERVTRIVHGEREMTAAQQVTQIITGAVSVAEASEATIIAMRRELPTAKVDTSASVVAILVESGLAGSNSEARQLLANKAVYINGTPVTKLHLESTDFQNSRLLLRKGKVLKNTALIELRK